MAKSKPQQLTLSLELSTALRVPAGTTMTPTELAARVEEHTIPASAPIAAPPATEKRVGWALDPIGKDAIRYALTLGPDVFASKRAVDVRQAVVVSYSDGMVGFTITGRKDALRLRMLEVKKQTAVYLEATYPDRKFFHERHRGRDGAKKTVWWWYFGDYPEGLTCGIKIGMTEEEKVKSDYGDLAEHVLAARKAAK